jgi:hypothetical protein
VAYWATVGMGLARVFVLVSETGKMWLFANEQVGIDPRHVKRFSRTGREPDLFALRFRFVPAIPAENAR